MIQKAGNIIDMGKLSRPICKTVKGKWKVDWGRINKIMAELSLIL